MRTIWMMTTALLTAAAAPAFAQGAAAPHTMDAQLEQLRATGQYDGQPAAAPAEVMQNQPMEGNPQSNIYRSMIDSQGSGAIPALPLDIQTTGQATYVSGGISDEEMDMLKSRAGEFNLHISMHSPGGAFMVASKFHILDSTGLEVLRIEDAGPYVYVKLPAGQYTVEAIENGEIKTAKVNVPASGSTRAQMTFKQN